MFRKFLKEKNGGVVEVIFLLAFIAGIILVISPGLRGHIYNMYKSVTSEIDGGTAVNKNYFDKNGRPIISTVGNKAFTVGIRTYASSSKYTTGTQFQFAADVSGGSGNFTYTWKNYNGSDTGKLGPTQNYNPGDYTVYLIVKDNVSGVSNQDTFSFTIENPPQVSGIAVYDTSGKTVTTPHTKIDYKIGIVVTNGSPDEYSCFWDSDITLSGYNETKTNPCNTTATFRLTAPQDIPINVTVCLKSDPTNCKAIADTIHISYPPIYIVDDKITASPSKAWYSATEGISFTASAAGGSGNLRLEWTNYKGSGAQVYVRGSQTVKVRACDNESSAVNCSPWTSFTFNVTNPIAFSLTADPGTLKINEQATFKVSGETGGSGSFIYYWTITDHGSSTYTSNTVLTKSFTSTGAKTASVRVCDAYNTTNCETKSISVNVQNPQPVNFSYTGGVQTFTVPQTGTYKLETWGAQGGVSSYYRPANNNGGYTSGHVNLIAGQVLQIHVGGKGGDQNETIDRCDCYNYNGGFNGGGSGVGSAGPGGGGATDIRSHDVTGTTTLYNWDFANSLQGFSSGTHAIYLGSGGLTSQITTKDGYFYSPYLLNFAGQARDKIEIKVKNSSSNTSGQIYFRTNGNSSYDQSRVVTFNMSANDSSYKTYTVSLNSNPNWRDQIITGLRFDLANDVVASGSFEVSSIKVNRATATESRIIVAGGGGGNANEGFLYSYGGYSATTGILYNGQSGDLSRHVPNYPNDEAGGGGGYHGGLVEHGDDPRASYGGTSYTGSLTNPIVKSGIESMPSPQGGTQNGQLGNGYVRITLQ